MTKAEKIEQLIAQEHPFEPAVAEIVEGIKQDFFQLEEGTISKENQDRAALELDDSLRKLKNMRQERLETQIDALLTLHSSGDKLKQAMVAAHDLKWEWVNAAKEMSPTLNGIVVDAGVNWMVNNTEGETAQAIATQPLEDLKTPTATEPTAA